MTKERMVLLHQLLHEFEHYLGKNVQSDKDGAMVADVHAFQIKIEAIIQPGS